MKKLLLFAVLFVVYNISVIAQVQRGLKGSYDLDSFPKISFVWNTINPEELGISHFALYEDNESVDFKLTALPSDNTRPINKSILILWEDMASHSRQSEFARELLTRFFREETILSTDRFEVAVFDRQKDTEKSILKPLVGQFSSDSYRLVDAVTSYKKSTRQYNKFPLQSDLYLAINEGVAMLKNEPANRAGVIIVVTAGLNMKASGASTEMETVRKNASEAGIPVYVVKYPLSGNTPEVNSLAESTYGLVTSVSTDVAVATDNLKQSYRTIDKRLRGRDYKFSFIAKSSRDGKPHELKLAVDKVNQDIKPYLSPKVTFGQWLIGHWWLVALIILFLAGGVVLAVVYSNKKKKEQELANQAVQEQIRRDQEESERRSREAVETMRREQEAKEQAAKEAVMRAQMAAEDERLSKLMKTKNLYPRLQCKVGTESFSYTIGKPRVTLGRDANNDVAFTMKNASFNNQTVSGHHAEIIFNGSTFEIVNKSHTYTQGIIVNGYFHQCYSLCSGDMIGLGEAIITFYQ